MKKSLMLSLTAVAFLIWSCSNSGSTQAEADQKAEESAQTVAEEAPAEEQGVPSQNVPAKGDAYEITVLDGSKPSPRKEMKGQVGDVEITVNYGSPSVRGRKIWGGLEPLNEVWRTGANEATRITFSKDVMVNGKKLAAGTYALFTIPTETEWTVIFNEEAEQWGAYKYQEGKDALRVMAQPMMKEELAEKMDFYIEGNDVILRWEKVAVPFSVSAA